MSKRRVGLGSLLVHTVLTFVTGGVWLVILGIRFLLKNS
jgi:hypothetical protein